MRIFSLATDEAVAIGDEIVVKVLEINGDEVQLGIERPDGASVVSSEAEQAIQLGLVS